MSAPAKVVDLFGKVEIRPMWMDHWWGMPEFSHEDLSPMKQLIVSFTNEDEMQEFSDLVGQKITMRTQSIWFKPQEIGVYRDKSYEPV